LFSFSFWHAQCKLFFKRLNDYIVIKLIKESRQRPLVERGDWMCSEYISRSERKISSHVSRLELFENKFNPLQKHCANELQINEKNN
jgi:hypothetical protein